MLNRASMKFNRQLFKEAYKMGYKEAKKLNEGTVGDEYKYKGLFSKLLDISYNSDTLIQIGVDHTGGKGYCGLAKHWFPGDAAGSLTIQPEDGHKYTTTLFEKDIVNAWAKNDTLCITFNNDLKTYLRIHFYKPLQIKELDVFNDLPSNPRPKETKTRKNSSSSGDIGDYYPDYVRSMIDDYPYV